VEAFPFNYFNDPMYLGSTLTFAGGALWYGTLLLLLCHEQKKKKKELTAVS